MKKLIYASLALLIFACNSDDNSDNVVDTEPPVVTLTGESSVYLASGATYVDEGATATDNVDGDLTSNIETTSDVDTSVGGIYTVTHTVTDTSGNMHSASRTVYADPDGCGDCAFHTTNCAQGGNTPITGKYAIFASAATMLEWKTNGGTQTIPGQLWFCDGSSIDGYSMIPIGEFVTNLQNGSNMDTYCTSGYTRMDGLFSGKTFYTGDKYIGRWDVSSVDTMESMFAGATAFNQDISMWDTRSVATMHAMFSDALAFNQDISNWNVSNVDDMSAMFSITYSFNQPLTTQQVTVGASTYTAWDVSNVNNMNAMFANSVFNQDITSWSVDNVTDCKDFSVASPLIGANTPNFSCPL